MSFLQIFLIVSLAIALDIWFIRWQKRRKQLNPDPGLSPKLFQKGTNRRDVFIGSFLFGFGILALIEIIGWFFSHEQFPTILMVFVVFILFGWLFKQKPSSLWAKDETSIDPPAIVKETGVDLPEENFSARGWLQEIRAWIQTHPIELIVVIAGGVLAIYVWGISPSVIANRFTLQGEEAHPFRGFLFVRVLLEQIAPQLAGWVGGVGSLISLAMLIPAHFYSRERAVSAGLIIAGLAMASLGQLAALGYYSGSPVRLYWMAILVFIVGSFFLGRFVVSDLLDWKLSPPWEISLFILVVALTIFARFYEINSFPYGIEPDEGNWTAKVTAAMLDGDYRKDAVFHIYTVPAGFFMQAPFLHLLGPGLISGRIAVAVYSILGSVVFYWVARELLNPQAALLSTALLAISLLDLSASRYSNVETLVKLWPLLTLLLLIWSLRSQKSIAYLLTGISAALGWLTYDTVLPILGVCLLIFAVEFHRNQIPWEERIRRLSVFLTPILLTIPTTIAYVSSRLSYYQLNEDQAAGFSIQNYLNAFSALINSLFVHTANDFFYNRNGPVFNSLLLPWLVLGLVIAILYGKQKKLSWILIFFFAFFIPAPILTQSPWGRVYYPGYAAAYLLIALAMSITYQEILYAVGKIFQPLLNVLVFSCLSLFVVFNLYIYFNETLDYESRQIRRELYEISFASATEDGMIYFPFLTRENNILVFEEPLIWLGMRSSQFPKAAERGYQMITPESLLLKLRIEGPSYEQITIVRDRTSTGVTLEQEPIFRDIRSCYPNLKIMVGHYFDRYQLDKSSVMNPFCTTPNIP